MNGNYSYLTVAESIHMLLAVIARRNHEQLPQPNTIKLIILDNDAEACTILYFRASREEREKMAKASAVEALKKYKITKTNKKD
jgi:hypothetical protein